MQNKTTRILVTIFGGWFGLHKFLDHRIGAGILYFLTGGLFGIGWIIDIIRALTSNQHQCDYVQFASEPPSSPIGNGLYEACIDVAGSSYYCNSIVRCMKRNPKYDLPDIDILKLGTNRTYEFFPLDANAILMPEPNNPHDNNAVMVLVDNNLVGYIPAEYALFVKNLISRRSLSFAGVSILGGNVKIVYSNRDVVIDRNGFRVKLKFTYRK